MASQALRNALSERSESKGNPSLTLVRWRTRALAVLLSPAILHPPSRFIWIGSVGLCARRG